MGNHTITIYRESAISGCALTHAVEVDGLTVGSLEDGGTISAEVSEGSHVVTFTRWKSVVKTIKIDIPEDSPGVYLVAKMTPSGRLEVLCSDYPRASEQPQKSAHKEITKAEKKSITRIAILALSVVVVFTAVFCVVSRQRDKPTAQYVTNYDLALDLQKQAQLRFESGDYKAGLDLCLEIAAKYPNTVVARHIQEFATAQVSQYTHISASDLASEYDENRVNADMVYDGEVVVVSGKVCAVDKTDYGNTLSVLLFSNSLVRFVQLNFDPSQEQAVANLRRGDSITAIGKCTGLSGTILLVFESDNVMVNNCLLIG